MSDETNQSENTATAKPRKRRIIRRLIFFVLVGLFLFLLPVISETYFKCAICAMRQTEQRVTGAGFLISSWERPTPSSDWYQANIEPEHDHVWVRGGYAEGLNCFGRTAAMWQDSSLSTGPYSWLPLSRDKQIRIYQKSPDPQQARAMFLQLAHHEPDGSKAYAAQQEIIRRLDAWIRSDMEAPWPFEKF
ncbi:hypothetical protein [uncultured Gimesia sp.]|uniref:hypothetical protein n=1 Tax=uncultured Gimesia sp. TaxID=1678688 RepID=UPI0030DA5CB7|tara:strand:+ start:76957 stop:77526 length:570 start_codon:yes stop_codon:yes gene_type:complete